MKKIIILFIVLVILAAAGGWYWKQNHAETAMLFVKSPVSRGDLLVSISATGTVQPEEVVDVGAQVAGQILSFGKDVNGKTVDYGSVVEEGTVLARIDDSVYVAEAAQAEAQEQSARSGLIRAEADLEQLKAKLYQAERDWHRAQKLGPSEALAESTYDSYRSAYEIAKSNVAVGEAAILQAKAAIAQAGAVVQRAHRNLGYCTIKSPVKGVIIDRRVNIGQTVVASLNAPSLFLIAKDLKRMQVWVAVNEADIGKIQPGQQVRFTVDAFPGEQMRGEVGKVRLNASMTQNVVTYTVEVLTDNSSGRLLPYLTANVQFELEIRKNVLQVPNASLRWMPQPGQIVADQRAAYLQTPPEKNGKPLPAQPAGEPSRKSPHQQDVVWVAEGDFVRSIPVRVGLTDGMQSEVEAEGLKPDMEVVLGVQTKDEQASTSNPFTPRMPGRSAGPRP